MLSNNKAWENISLYQSKNFSKVLLGSTACLLEGIRYSLFLEMKIIFRIINAFEESCLASLYALVVFFCDHICWGNTEQPFHIVLNNGKIP